MTDQLKIIHYGSTVYKPELVKPIKKDWVKPLGGLWTSPVNSKYSWKDWCCAENYSKCEYENSFTLQLNEGAKIFIINCLKDLKNAPLYTFNLGSYNKQYLDYEFLSTKFDAIWLTENGCYETHLSHPVDLYGWDCETVLIMKPDCCFQISAAQRYSVQEGDATMPLKV